MQVIFTLVVVFVLGGALLGYLNGSNNDEKIGSSIMGGFAGWEILKTITTAALPFIFLVWVVMQCSR
jgi:hypothetical protein